MADSSLLALNNDIWLSLTEDGLMDRFLRALFNDLNETKVEKISDVVVTEIGASQVANKTIKKGEYKNLSGFCINCKLDGITSEIILLDEEIPYLQWWHDKSFFTLNYYYEHVRAVADGFDDIKKRMVVSFLLDNDLLLDKFHTIKYFDMPDATNPGNVVQDKSFIVHDVNFKYIPEGAGQTQLSLWASLLVASSMEEIENITKHQL